jgi:hypothetical protein
MPWQSILFSVQDVPGYRDNPPAFFVDANVAYV